MNQGRTGVHTTGVVNSTGGKMKKLIAVSGSNAGDSNLTRRICKLAEEVGRLIAERDGILLCGGLGGIMEAAAKGAKQAKGITVGILPGKKEKANPYIDIPIATGLGYFRNYILVAAADALIAICGRWGTMNELSMAMALGKKTIVLADSGGISREFSQGAIRGLQQRPLVATTPEEAVSLAFD
jgi:uncharacterized protein (TIGR00725 family)